MFQEFLSRSPLTIWPLMAFVLFFTIFVGVCLYLVVGKAMKKDFDHVANLPLEEDGAGNPR